MAVSFIGGGNRSNRKKPPSCRMFHWSMYYENVFLTYVAPAMLQSLHKFILLLTRNEQNALLAVGMRLNKRLVFLPGVTISAYKR